MSAERVSVSLPEDVRRASQPIADELGLSFSAVVAEAPSIRPNTVPSTKTSFRRSRPRQACLPRAWSYRGAGGLNLVLDAGALIAVDPE